MECLLCLESNQDVTKCIQVDSMQWQEYSIKKLIDQHLWPIEPLTSTSHLCSACWEELNDFHKFYNRIEEAHNDTKLMLKTETDPLQEDNKPKDLLLENLLEPEILIGQRLDTPIEIKQESEEAAVVHKDDNEKDNNISLDILDDDPDEDPDDHAFINDSSDDSDDSDSDDDLPLIRRECKSQTSTKTRSSSKQSPAKDKSNHAKPIIKETKRRKKQEKPKSKCAAENKKKSTRKTSTLPKINRVEYDKFLKEHFKMTCDKCQQTFERFRFLCQHYSKEHNEQGFALCCGTKFFNRRLLVDHINYHLNPEYFKCELCGKVLTKRICLIGHMKMHEEKKYCCDMCDKKFVLKHKLDKHKLTHLPESEKKFQCKECGKFYANEYILTQHQRAVHLNVYAKICEICGQTMPDSHTFKRHMEKHDGIAPATSAKCDICGLILTSQHTLKLHKELKHPVGDKRDHNCHICNKVSPNMRALKKHIREAHEIGYRFKCTVCEKEFKRSDNFKSHMAMHAGTPLYRCAWCPKEFNSNGNMHQHRKKAHPIEWEEAQRKKYSGNLPPNFKRSSTYNSQYPPLSNDINQE